MSLANVCYWKSNDERCVLLYAHCIYTPTHISLLRSYFLNALSENFILLLKNLFQSSWTFISLIFNDISHFLSIRLHSLFVVFFPELKLHIYFILFLFCNFSNLPFNHCMLIAIMDAHWNRNNWKTQLHFALCSNSYDFVVKMKQLCVAPEISFFFLCSDRTESGKKKKRNEKIHITYRKHTIHFWWNCETIAKKEKILQTNKKEDSVHVTCVCALVCIFSSLADEQWWKAKNFIYLYSCTNFKANKWNAGKMARAPRNE